MRSRPCTTSAPSPASWPRRKKHFAEELISYPDAPEEPVSASDLIRQQQEILARNGENQRLRAQYTELERQEQQCVAELKRTRERIAELEQQYQELDAKHTHLFNQRKTAQKTVAQLPGRIHRRTGSFHPGH